MEMTVQESEDYFELVECQDVGVEGRNGKKEITMQIKIITAGNRCHIMSYNLETMQEITWLSVSRDAKIFYGNADLGRACYVYDADFGFVELHNKELLLEYHALDKNKDHLGFEQAEMGVQWGSRRVKLTGVSELMIFANTVLLPFSYFNIIQRF